MIRFTVVAACIAASMWFGRPAESQQRRPRTPPRTTRPDTTRRPPATRPAAQARRPAPPPTEKTVAIFGGGALAGLDFGVGPSVGMIGRYRKGTWPIALRADGMFSRFSQTPSLGGVALTTGATLSHFGAGVGAEYPLGTPRATAPYLLATVGVYRFAGSGPAGDAGDIVNGEFASTTDVAGAAGMGMRFFRRVSIEARVVSVGDFTLVPLTVGFRF